MLQISLRLGSWHCNQVRIVRYTVTMTMVEACKCMTNEMSG